MTIPEILKNFQTIAVVGLSDNPAKPSNSVTRYMISAGYNIIPINPSIETVFGLKSYPSLTSLPEELKKQIQIVNIFRKPDDVLPIVEDAIAIGAKVIWMQLGITNEIAAQKAKIAGMEVVQNHCIAVDHQTHFS